MKKKTKIALVVGAAVVGGTIWYLRNKKQTSSSPAAAIAPAETPTRTSSLPAPAPEAINQFVYSGSVETQQEPVYTKPLVQPIATQALPKIYPSSNLTTLTKTNYLLQREMALAGVLF